MKLNKNIKLTLIGAGPGDSDLITVKGVKGLSKTTVIESFGIFQRFASAKGRSKQRRAVFTARKKVQHRIAG